MGSPSMSTFLYDRTYPISDSLNFARAISHATPSTFEEAKRQFLQSGMVHPPLDVAPGD